VYVVKDGPPRLHADPVAHLSLPTDVALVRSCHAEAV